MVDGVRSKAIPPSEVVRSFVEGVAEGIVETGTFSSLKDHARRSPMPSVIR
ncbi:MAG: hypothetical protein U1E78_05990 [Gammaproteobacteria bacterium]